MEDRIKKMIQINFERNLRIKKITFDFFFSLERIKSLMFWSFFLKLTLILENFHF